MRDSFFCMFDGNALHVVTEFCIHIFKPMSRILNIVTSVTIAVQRFGKHVPTRTNKVWDSPLLDNGSPETCIRDNE
jgi:hypothetical protein